jgi:hypothetical protein
MKLHKWVSYTALVIVLLALLLLASLPFRFPHSFIAWEPALLFLSPAIVLVVFLFMKPLVSRKIYLSLNVVFAGIMIWLSIADRMSPILTGIFLGGCFALYFSKNTYQQHSLR